MRLRLGILVALVMAASGVGKAQNPIATVTDVGPGTVGRMLQRTLADPRVHVIVALDRAATILTRDSTYPATVVILGSRVTLSGTIHGDIIVVGGDLFVHPGAVVEGRAVAIGGAVYPSMLAKISGGSASYRDIGFAATKVGTTIELRYRPVAADPTPFLTFPGYRGLRKLSYDRSSGLGVSFGPRISLDSSRVQIDPRLTYRSQVGLVDPFLIARVALDRRNRGEVTVGRGSFTNDGWIVGDLMNSVRSLWNGHDARNWYRADRGEAKLFRLWEGPNGMLEPYVGGRVERAWSARPDSSPVGGPWSIVHPRSAEGMRRPNPGIDAGTIVSVLAGAHLDWDNGTLKSVWDGDIEAAPHAPNDRHFVQTTIDGRVAFPTFGNQRLRTDLHAVITVGDTAPRQRWAYIGGAGTFPTFELLDRGGDELLVVDSRYEIPITAVKIGPLGNPTFTIRNVLGNTAIARFPAFVESVGGRISLGPFRAELMTDTERRKASFSIGLALTR